MTKLEKILKERGVKQVWLAEKINKSPAELNRWLKGKVTPAYENMCKISKTLNVPVEDIFFNDVDVVSANDNYITDITCTGNNEQPEEIKVKDLRIKRKKYIDKP